MKHLTEFALRVPKLSLAIIFGISIFLGFGASQVEPAFGFRVLVGDDHPAIKTLDEMIEEFSGGLPLQIGWECGPDHPCKHVFDRPSLSMADAVTKELAMARYVRDVQSPANAPILVPAEQGFQIRRFVTHGELAPDFEALAQHALQDRLWTDHLVAQTGLVGVITVQPSDNRASTDLSIMDSVYRALAPFESAGFTYYLTGEAPRIAAGKGLSESTSRLIPVLVLLIGGVLLFLTRSWQQSLIALATMGLSLLWTLGILGWVGWPQDGMLEVLAPLIVIVGVCDAIHLLSRYAEKSPLCSSREGARSAMIKAASEIGPACLVTTLTTAGALLSFTASSLDTFFRFGVISAIGVANCLVLTFTFLPLVSSIQLKPSPEIKRNLEKWQVFLTAVARTSARRNGALLMAAGVLMLFFGFGWFNYLKADQNWLEAWGERSTLTQSIRFFENQLGKSQRLELQLSLPREIRLEDPDTLEKLSSLSDSLSSIDGLGRGTSILSFLDRIKNLLHDPENDLVREVYSIRGNAELLELISLGDPEMLAKWVNFDRSKVRLSLGASEISHRKRSLLMDKVEDTLAHSLPPGWEVSLSGEVALSRDWTRDVQNTQRRSFPIAFLIVFVLVSGFLRSWKLGLAAMVPTLVPVVVVLGSMGWLGMSLDVARAMIATIVIGIGVDDAVHLLSHYQQSRKAGSTSRTAIREAVLATGQAIATTSIALTLGFLTLVMSDWQTISSFGFFVALAIMGALIATFFLLPALIYSLSPEVEP
jgi:predicted RND superfamily exporter protein